MFSFIGFITLSLSMQRHHAQVFPASLPPTNRSLTKGQILIRGFGYCSLCISAAMCILSQGSIGIVTWTGLSTVAALLQVMLLAYRPQWITTIGIIVFLISLIMALTIHRLP